MLTALLATPVWGSRRCVWDREKRCGRELVDVCLPDRAPDASDAYY